MQLQLSESEAVILRGMLHDYLGGLRFEAARTEAREMRHLMIQRQDLCERLLADLETSARQ